MGNETTRRNEETQRTSQNELTKSRGRTKTIYRHPYYGTRNRWTEEGQRTGEETNRKTLEA